MPNKNTFAHPHKNYDAQEFLMQKEILKKKELNEALKNEDNLQTILLGLLKPIITHSLHTNVFKGRVVVFSIFFGYSKLRNPRLPTFFNKSLSDLIIFLCYLRF